MSMERNDALTQLAGGLRKFEGYTAQQVLDSGWAGLKGLHPKDLNFFRANSEMPAESVAQACHRRSLAHPEPAVE